MNKKLDSKKFIIDKIISIRQCYTVVPRGCDNPRNDIPEFCPFCGFKMMRDCIEWEGSSIGEN